MPNRRRTEGCSRATVRHIVGNTRRLMRALVQRAPRALAIVDMDEPVAPPGHVVVRSSAVGICGSDLKVWDVAAYGTGVVLGHEVAGVVEDVGDGVDASLIGTRAAI